MKYIDIVPGFELVRDRSMRPFISRAQIRERAAGENYAPTERVVWSIALVNFDVVSGVGLFHEDGEVHPRRSAADDVDFHQES